MTNASIRINDPNDPRIMDYLSVRERDLTGREHKFIIESLFVLQAAMAQDRFVIASLLLAAHKVEKLGAEITAAHHRGIPVYLAEQAVMDAIAGFNIHRGVLAVGVKPAPRPLPDLLSTLPERCLIVVGLDISNHDNVGGIFRNAAAFGADAVILDDRSCDPFYRKAIRVSAGHVLNTSFHHGGDQIQLVSALEQARITPLALSPRGQHDIRQLVRPDRCAILLGAEGPGLSDDVMANCQTVRIPMSGTIDSLNVATAAAVALSHLSD